MKNLLTNAVIPFEVNPSSNAKDILERMQDISFQGRNLGIALKIWKEMLEDDTTIFFGLAGAMIPAGMRRLMVFLIENRYIDCLVSTGANLFHDCHEIMGYYHYIGNHEIDDAMLRKCGIDRIYDTFANDEEFNQIDFLLADFTSKQDNRPYTTREYLYLLGKSLIGKSKEDGILTSSAKAGVPIYCPAFGDSSLGIASGYAKVKYGFDLQIDIVGDVLETEDIVQKAKASGVIFIGGGTPKNFIQQTEVTANILGFKVLGHHYAIQITQDSPHWGGLSGCTFDEAKSWGKIHKDAKKVSVYADSTITFPFLVSAIAGYGDQLVKKRKKPNFKIDGRKLEVT